MVFSLVYQMSKTDLCCLSLDYIVSRRLDFELLLVYLIRRIRIFPKGNKVDYLSMYLDVADSGTLPYGWSRYAHFSLAVVNQIYSKYSIRKGVFLY